MENQKLADFFSDLRTYHLLTPHQRENGSRLIELSENFHKKAGIPSSRRSIPSERTIVLESGHQPNLLPHAGTWKKAFLLNHLQSSLEAEGETAVAFFGFADRNITTAKVLAKNQIPDLNKTGFTKIGFKVQDADRPKSFNRVSKPSVEQWQAEIDRLRQHYRTLCSKTGRGCEAYAAEWDLVLSLLWKSFERADNAAELNAIVFAAISREVFGSTVSFYLLSDLFASRLFIGESRRTLQNTGQFNAVYNREIDERHLEIPPVAENHLPFWYECECGMKLDLFIDDAMTCHPACPACKKEYEIAFGNDFTNLEEYYPSMDFNAVSRDIITAEALGDSLFLSGTGGSLEYGKLSDRIAEDLKFHRPLTLAWRSRDYYLGMIHAVALRDMMKTLSLTPEDISRHSLREKVLENLRKIPPNKVKAAENLIGSAANLFSAVPSCIDILANYSRNEIITCWETALLNADIQRNGSLNRFESDIQYPVRIPDLPSFGDVSALYGQVRNLGVV